ncbi:MAG: tetratricopeptide repeat protein [Planctomycetota bacterium]|jgi:tetratricopeptide (TPR) repeat protein|nr:tetratricopeptide repeat protein [Planctomycetota bacterium]
MKFTTAKFIGSLFITLLVGLLMLAGVYRHFGLGGQRLESDPTALAAQAKEALDAVRNRRPGERRPASYDAVLQPLDRLLQLSRELIHSVDYDPMADFDKLFATAMPAFTIAGEANAQAQTETGPLAKDFRFNAQRAEAAQYLAAALWSRTTANHASAEGFGGGDEPYPPAEIEWTLSTINAGLEADPENRSLWYLRGAVNRAAGLFAAAARDLERSLELDPGNPEAENALGLVYIDLKQLDKAEEHIEKARAAALQIASANGTAPGADYTTIIFNLARFHEGLAAFYARENRLAPSAENARLTQKHSDEARKHLGEFLSREPAGSPDAALARRLLDGLPSQ